jgi:hypothetical protein
VLSAAQLMEVERNHFHDDGEPKYVEEVSAAQGDVHWLDWPET